jgi:biotin carboxyl carrier protein
MTDDTFQTLLLEDAAYETRLTRKFIDRKFYAAPDPKKLLAFIPGVIQKIHVKPGQRVKRGDPLLVLEAMKMKNDLASPRDGSVKDIYVRVGQMVAKDVLLLEFD